MKLTINEIETVPEFPYPKGISYNRMSNTLYFNFPEITGLQGCSWGMPIGFEKIDGGNSEAQPSLGVSASVGGVELILKAIAISRATPETVAEILKS